MSTEAALEKAVELLRRTDEFFKPALVALGPFLDLEDKRVRELIELARDIRDFLGKEGLHDEVQAG